MDSIFWIKSEQDNVYLIDIVNKNIGLVHPYLPYLYYQNPDGKCLLDEGEQEYYKNKLRYYIKHGIISEKTEAKNELLTITKESVNENLANVKQIVFETTEKCNLRCNYCIYGEFYSKEIPQQKDIKSSTMKEVVRYLSEKQLSSQNYSSKNTLYISFYGGEPLINFSAIKDVVDYNKKGKFQNRVIKFSMTTNGTLLDKYIDFMVENNVNILVSLDGDKENHQYRVYKNGRSSFDKIMSNIEYIKNKYPTFFENNVNFASVLHNKNSVEQVHSFFKQKFGKTPSILELNNSGILDNKKADFDKTYKNKTESMKEASNYDEIQKDMFIATKPYQSVLIFLFQYSKFIFKSYEDILSPDHLNRYISTGTCAPFSRKIFVTTTGEILPCEKISHEYSLGKIEDNGEITIDSEAIAEKYNYYLKLLERQCKHCYQQLNCTQCIFFIENLNERPVCKGFMNKKDFVFYLRENMSFLESHPQDYMKMMTEVLIS